jgi:hypothetical protein
LATRIFAGIGISLDWRACEPADESSQTPIVVQLVSGKKEGLMSGVLGSAMPYRRHIIIFFDRIETMQDPWTVLGHVMVHEITHIIQGVSRHSDTGLMKPHWSMDCVCESEPDQYRAKIQELSQHIIPIYFNLMTLLHLLDIDLHNSLFYQCSGLLQKYHMVASGRGGYGDEKEKSFYDQHVPFLNEVLALFELVEEMVHDSSSNLMIPSSTASLWVHEIRLVLDMFELYKSDL